MNSIALITGATSGIGLETARVLASKGFNLIISGRRADRLEKIAAELSKEYSIKVYPLPGDVRDPKSVEQQLNSLPNEWKKISVLVNNAGLAAGLASFQEGLLSDFDQMIDTNIKGLIYVSKMVIPWMIKEQNGHIINIGSIAGKETYPNGNVYCATKEAVDALSRGMRIDLVSHGIKVTAIHPGAVETEFSMVRFKGDATRAASVYQGFEPLTPKDIAHTIDYVLHLPKHVCINELTIMPTAQASAGVIHRK